MLLKDVLKLPTIRVLEKDEIWRIVDFLYLDGADNSDNFNLVDNNYIKINILIEKIHEEGYITVYYITFKDMIVAVGKTIENYEDVEEYDIYCINEDLYDEMIEYLYSLRIREYLGKKETSLDFDFKL